MMFIIVMVFTLLVVGNAVLNRTIDALYEVYAENISGDITISPVSDNNFTVFGSDQLLIGQYLVPPTLVNFSEIRKEVDSLEQVTSTAGLVTSACRVEIGNRKNEATVFGVDFEDYAELVPKLDLVEGSFPEAGEKGVVLQHEEWKDVIGKKALLVSSSGQNFTLREVPVTGTFSYPVRDKMIRSVVLVDVDTARSLNGYLYDQEQEPVSSDDQKALDSSFSDLFGNPDASSEQQDSEEEGINPEALFSSDEGGSEKRGTVVKGAMDSEVSAWNFLLIKLHSRKQAGAVHEKLNELGYTRENGYSVRDWKKSVGGNAQIAWVLQLLFNFGLIFVSFGAAIIATNAILLSILERTKEIGTLRAIGAAKSRVSFMVFTETLIIVFGSGLIGIIAGWAGVQWLNASDVVLRNQYMRILFGGSAIQGTIDLSDVLSNLSAAFILTVVAMLYPLKKALSVSPVEAMAE